MSAESTPAPTDTPAFTDLALGAPLLRALSDVGYETPSPIQAATIPPLLAGRDVIGQAQTGTGKTAAFALPILAQIDPALARPQALVLTPTRELAIQVAEAFQKYAHYLPNFQILPIYGGQGYAPQLQALKRGVHVVVGTPGRIIDHLKRGTLDLSHLRCIVLDEADEMLRMGFIDDVQSVLDQTPPTRQVALFSATMPPPIRRIAQTYLKDPIEVAIKSTTTTTPNIRQRFCSVSGHHKLDAITRVLEAESFDAMIVFARTKIATEELAQKLAARGIAVGALNGDIPQQQREKTVQALKDGKIDVLVATDVAARGLDVDRVSHVLNYDIPYDTESYVHRIGRTGRAGRQGEAILFVTPRERGMLRAIERATRQPIEPMDLPTVEAVNQRRVDRFLEKISGALDSPELPMYRELIEQFERERNVPAVEIAAALARLAQGESPLLMSTKYDPLIEAQQRAAREERSAPQDRFGRSRDERTPRPERGERPARFDAARDGTARPPRRDTSWAPPTAPRAPSHAPSQTASGPAAPAPPRAAPVSPTSAFVAAPGHAVPSAPSPEQRTAAVPSSGQPASTPPQSYPPSSYRPASYSPPAPAATSSTDLPPRTLPPHVPAARRTERAAPPRSEPPRGDNASREGMPRQAPEIGMETFRIEVGHQHGVKPGNIVGAIANEADLESRYIGRIDIREAFTLIDLPSGMPREVMDHLKRVRVAGQQLKISRDDGGAPRGRRPDGPRRGG